MRNRFTHVFFDLDNTLWDFKTNSRLSMEATFNALNVGGGDVKFSDFFECYSENNNKLWAAYRKKEIKKKELTKLRFQLTFETMGIKSINPQEMNEWYLTEMPRQKVLIDGAIEVLGYLKQKKYKLFIITNGFKEVQLKKLESSGLAPYFEKIFISEELKCPKPGRAIFEHAIRSVNAKKNNSLMVGDDWDVDIMGAKNFGIASIYFSNGRLINETKKEEIMASDCTVKIISNLTKLKEIL